MSEKNLIIGGASNLGIRELTPWVCSINEKIHNAHKVLCVGNITQETADWLTNQGFELIFSFESDPHIHVSRFRWIYNYLKNNYQNYRFVVTTDVRDVYFQNDPFEFLYEKLEYSQYKLIAGSESIRYKDEIWGNSNLFHTYGQYIYDDFKNNEIYNVGTIGGESEYVKDLVFNIFSNATNRPILVCDQAVYNVLLNTQPYKNITNFLSQKSGWACQAGTTADPLKIENFRPFLTEKEPFFEEDIIKTCNGIPFTIVHQYDRVPKWKEFIDRKYNII